VIFASMTAASRTVPIARSRASVSAIAASSTDTVGAVRAVTAASRFKAKKPTVA
jgi:hypothetical protein